MSGRPVITTLVTALLLAGLAGCGPDEDGDGGGAADDTPSIYQVPNSDCPAGWTGLTVTTDKAAEVDYLDDVPACTNANGTATYLENESDAVWLLQTTSPNAGTANSMDPSLGEQSFVAAVSDQYPGRAIFVPGSKMAVNLAPEDFEWVIDLPLSFGWQAHDVVVDKIAGAGEAAVIAALKRESRAGAALAVCTLAVTEYAEATSDLEDADASSILLDGLGVGVATNKCRIESASVTLVDEAGRPITLADDLARLRAQTEVLAQVHGRLSLVQRASRVLGLGLRFVR